MEIPFCKNLSRRCVHVECRSPVTVGEFSVLKESTTNQSSYSRPGSPSKTSWKGANGFVPLQADIDSVRLETRIARPAPSRFQFENGRRNDADHWTGQSGVDIPQRDLESSAFGTFQVLLEDRKSVV